MKHILIISDVDDSHLPFVTKHLDNSEVIRIDPVEILKGNYIDYLFVDGKMNVIYKGEKLSSIESVWYRRPTLFERHMLPVAEKELDYSLSALQRHNNAFTHLFPDAMWISTVRNIRRAENKPLQIKDASRIGFNIPDTLFASDPEQAKAFVQKYGVCVAKTQAVRFPTNRTVFTKIITKEDNLSFDGIKNDPYIFQELIDPLIELRVTVVGDKVFAATVHCNEDDSKYRDWRYAHLNDTFSAEEYELPAKLQKQCIQLVNDFGLEYGAIDIIIDKMNKPWFLEINANGQWAFIEEKTGQPIGKEIARRLQEAK